MTSVALSPDQNMIVTYYFLQIPKNRVPVKHLTFIHSIFVDPMCQEVAKGWGSSTSVFKNLWRQQKLLTTGY